MLLNIATHRKAIQGQTLVSIKEAVSQRLIGAGNEKNPENRRGNQSVSRYPKLQRERFYNPYQKST